MRKINCDFCGEDISNYESVDDNHVYYYDDEFDLCKECFDKYFEMRNECADLRYKLSLKYNEIIEDEIRKFSDKRISKLKEN